MTDLEKKVLDCIREKAGLKASDIAKSLKVSRKEVNHHLYKNINVAVFRDNAYRWYLEKPVEADLTVKPSVISSGQTRGNQFFIVHSNGENITVEYNTMHKYFTECYGRLDDSAQAAVDALLNSFSQMVDVDYDQTDFYEDLIDTWGRYLNKVLK